MKVLLQRVQSASVTVDSELVGTIEKGYLLFVGLTHEDNRDKVQKAASKVAHLRLFKDDNNKMNLSLKDVGGEALVVSQFTLYGDTRKGRRPSFVDAMIPEKAEPLIDWFVDCLKAEEISVSTGRFGADMQVALVNDGPVTLEVVT